ncbi:peptide/nickel transport system ATP-binding protein [Conyzicola lurida]|uniref:Peptide/nickel transport system ATP-binding protein n=1 Tax=Conyzicola lurida TaxID=1172621 RepID=A0A841AES0_9MICO|nr:ABC transporter ATP-binding protein [Conyzicola lurida]MBB5841737.1 peptide/nickel transport system ATP-binding protein [Conyzicola lurida]
MNVPTKELVAQVVDLRVSFATEDGLVQAVKGVDLEIRAGEILAIVGESGSGKTVLSSCLMGLPPTSRKTTVTGSVLIAGVDMIEGDEKLRREVRRNLLGAVFQDPLTSLDPMMKIGAQVRERGATQQRGVDALVDCGVPEPEMRMDQWPHALSGGLRQRVSIASALTTDIRPPVSSGVDSTRIGELVAAQDGTPILLIADEPTTALDVRVQAQIIALFARLREEHDCSIVLITHDLGVAGQIADRVAVMYQGELVEVGPTEQVLRDPQHEYTRRLLDARLDIKKVFATAEREPAVDVSAAPDLVLTDIVKSYPKAGGRRGERLTVVNGVSLSVPRGGSLALVGESGCGKSTLLRIATGLTAADSGTVGSRDGERPQLVFQDAGSSLTPWLSIESQIGERLRSRRFSRAERAEETNRLLGRVGLDTRAARARPRELSGGQRQRAAIARALASNPNILVCDEPVSALDASLAARVLDLLEELRETMGIAILMVTHDLAVAKRISNTVAVMYAGEIIERGSSSEVFASPQHPYTRELLAASPTIY